MESVSTRLTDETARLIRETADERGVSQAEVLREVIEKGLDYDELETENDRLRRQLQATNQRVEEHQDLVEYVEEERSLSKQRAQAGMLTRAKWWLTGMPSDDDEQ